MSIKLIKFNKSMYNINHIINFTEPIEIDGSIYIYLRYGHRPENSGFEVFESMEEAQSRYEGLQNFFKK